MAEKVTMFRGDDPELLKANQLARDTFGYFWRELHWERRRIVPAHDYAMVKAAFHDGKGLPDINDSSVEHMWVNDIVFDGKMIQGVLINQPNYLKSVKKGDVVGFPLEQLGDWIFCIAGIAHGAFTVNLLRSKMSEGELKEHDAAWGVDFGNPGEQRVIYSQPENKTGLKGLFGKKNKEQTSGIPERYADHPMCINMVAKYKEQISKDPSVLETVDKNSWTLLHHEALAGNLATVKLFLEHNVNANAVTAGGQKASDLAAVLNWDPVVEVLKAAEG